MHLLILFISGIVTALPLVIPELGFLSWISLVPFIYITIKYKGSYLYGLLWSLGYYGVLYYWFVYLYPLNFAGLSNGQSVAAIIAAWLGLTILQGTEHAFVPLIFKIINKKRENIITAFLFAAVWVVIEWLQTQTWAGVPWGRLAVSQYKMLPVIRSASLFGSMFVSFLIVAVNGFLTLALIKFLNKNKNHASRYAMIGLIIFITNLSFGMFSLGLYKEYGEPIKIALIQGNIQSGEKWGDNSLEFAVNCYTALCEEAEAEYDPDIMLWAETVIPTNIKNTKYLNDIKELAVKTESMIIFGAYDTVGQDIYNAVFTINSDGTLHEEPYYKRHLVPFGEYLPMPNLIKTFLPVLAELNVFNNEVTPGKSTAVTSTEFGEIGYLICFDSIYETLTSDTVRDGAEIIMLSTNDSWYKDSAAVYQHNGHAVLRATESDRYIARAANTGVSSIIRADGRILSYLEPLVEGNVYGEVYMRSSRTLYSYIGNLIVILAFVYIAGIFIYNIIKKEAIKN